jgi:hypothetical protein
VLVPEATLDLDDGPVFGQNNIWLPGKFPHMETKSEAHPVERLPDRDFRLGVL